METPLRTSALPVWLLDPVEPTVEAATHGVYRLAASQRSWLFPILAGVVLLALSVVGWLTDPKQFYFSYLVGWAFCVALALGSLFFVMIHHLTRSHWAVVVRRIAEVAAMSFPLLAVLSIPIFIGMHDLFHWTHEDLYDPASPNYDKIIAGKRSYLNTPFFIARMVAYFAIWILLAWKLYRLSLRQDVDPDRSIPAKQRWWSALGIPLFAVTLAFGSYDFLMSLDPHWFSTIFGVYYFAGAFWSAVAFIVFVALLIQRAGALNGIVSTNHYHDLGKWMFAFTVFWAYIAFSQYMLIWYGHLEEEEIWYEHRLTHGWGYHSAALLVMHFILPFLILLFQSAKKSRGLLAFMAVWFFVMQWFDLHWLALPVLTTAQLAEGHHASTFHWLDLTTWLGLFALFTGLFFRRLSRHPLVPVNDPRLGRSLDHAHV
jgi:hypothetical protein